MGQAGPKRKLSTDLSRFLAVGAIATATHWLVMAVMVSQGRNPTVSTAVGAAIGLHINYIGQHRFAFRSTVRHGTAFPRYLASAVLGWIVNLTVFMAAAELVGQVAVAQLMATSAATIINFIVARGMVFNAGPI
ncbi:GtrA family protein [Halospina sp. K52047b]|uniref:GtrA family protein n=1 Tax=Halospina sp. K52047b TaxID=2614160 RepID=UPI00124A0BA9|nr:GtrA family protein [Halospina sp. K52047b]KAA8980365.1 GtrA family protein [Halospina sp. K52047b]